MTLCTAPMDPYTARDVVMTSTAEGTSLHAKPFISAAATPWTIKQGSIES